MGSATLVGHKAGFGRGGYRNVAIGDSAMGFGSGKTAVNKNIAIGYHALYRIDTNGESNIAIGHEASQFLTTAIENIAIGDNAIRSSTANRIMGIGYQAGYSNTSGGSNTFIGERAGYTNTTSANNTYIGDQTGYSASGANNTSIGKSAFGGGFGHTGTDNVAIGYQADQQPTGASNYNVAVGSEALRQGGTRTDNVAVGYKAATAITDGSFNIASTVSVAKSLSVNTCSGPRPYLVSLSYRPSYRTLFNVGIVIVSSTTLFDTLYCIIDSMIFSHNTRSILSS